MLIHTRSTAPDIYYLDLSDKIKNLHLLQLAMLGMPFRTCFKKTICRPDGGIQMLSLCNSLLL